VVTYKETDLEINAEKIKCMVVLTPECRTESQHKDKYYII